MSPPWAVVLAAGQGTRMGAGPTKLARAWGTDSVLATTLRSLSEAGWPTLVVLGGTSGELLASVHEVGATIVYNDHYTSGVGSSVSAGVKTLPEGVGAVMIVLGDMPSVPAEHYTALRAAWHGGAAIAVTRGADVLGPPVVFDGRYRAALEALGGDVGARAIWQEHAEAVVEVAAHPDWVRDIDAPDDLSAR